jgi:hypothetical protein
VDAQSIAHALQGAPFPNLAFGASGILLVNAAELDKAQIGYGVSPTGELLAGYSVGDWNPHWLVIGHDELVGDPIFVDSSQTSLPVYTAMHGVGDWEPVRIGDSLESFFRAMQVVHSVAEGRETPVALENNPLSDDDRSRVLERIRDLNPTSESDFWASLLDEDF